MTSNQQSPTGAAAAARAFMVAATAVGLGASTARPSSADRRAGKRTALEQAQVDLYNVLQGARSAGRYKPEDLDRHIEALRGTTRVKVGTRYLQLTRREIRAGLDAAARRELAKLTEMVEAGHKDAYLNVQAPGVVGRAARRRIEAESRLGLSDVYAGKAPAMAWASGPCKQCGRPQGVPNAACAGHVSNGKVIKRRRGTVLRIVAIGV